MNFIFLTDMSILMTFLSVVIVEIFPSLVDTYHLECSVAGLKYLPLADNSQDLMTCLSMVLFFLKVYGEYINTTM